MSEVIKKINVDINMDRKKFIYFITSDLYRIFQNGCQILHLHTQINKVYLSVLLTFFVFPTSNCC